MEGRFAQGFGISVTMWCKLVAEACICAERRDPLAILVADILWAECDGRRSTKC